LKRKIKKVKAKMKKQKPLISVIIPALNSERTIKQCIKSLIQQSLKKKEYEIIIIDNGSTDKTLGILDNYKKKIKILKESKKGSYNARNKGIRNSQGNIIAFTDSDCIADKNWLLNIRKAFSNKEIKIVGGHIEALEKNSYIRKYCNRFGHAQDLHFKSKKPCFATSNMAVRKTEIKKVGLFNPTLKSGGDFELCHRIIKSKLEITYEPNAIIKHSYTNSLIEFIERYYRYGKGQGMIKKKYKKIIRSPHPSYLSLIKNKGISHIPLRIIQDTSFKIGCIVGRIISIEPMPKNNIT